MNLEHNNSNRLFTLLILSLSFLSSISCTKEKENNIPTSNNFSTDTIANNKKLDTNVITYLALGDSYTIGESVAKDGRFPVQLVDMLRKDSVQISDPEIIAATGWTTESLLTSLKSNPPKQTYSFVTLLIGVNNQYQGRTLEEYKTQFTELLNRSVQYANGIKNHVFVLSIPDYSVTPFARGRDTQKIAREIDQFNEANKNISLNFGVHYLDITPISREAENDPSLIAGDGLHPSANQYVRWDQLLAPLVVQEIQ